MLGDRRRSDVGSGGEFDGEEVGRGGGDAERAEGLCDLLTGISDWLRDNREWRVCTLLFVPKLNTISLWTFRLFNRPVR